MAIFSTNFSEYSIGSSPSDWTERWAVANASYSVADGDECGGKILAADVTGSGHPAISWDDVDSLTDVEILVKFRRKGTTTGNESNHFIVRGVGVTPLHGYFLEFQTIGGTQTLKFGRMVSGSYTALGAAVTITTYAGANNWNYVRFQCRGTALKVKLWDASTSEPGSWQIERTDANITAAGWSGFGHGNQTSYDYDVDFFALGEGTDSPAIPTCVDAGPIVSTISVLGDWGAGDTDIVADPIISTISVLGNFDTSTSIIADPIISTLSILGNWSGSTIIVADPIVSTISIHGNWVHDLAIVADPIVITISHVAILSQWPSGPKNPDLDIEFDCSGRDRFGNQGQGIPVYTVGVEGVWLNKNIVADPINVVASQVGGLVSGVLLHPDPIVVTIGLKDPGILTETSRTNWVKWSDIGSLDFAIDKTNVAGERPLDWKGWIYDIRKMGDRVVVYGENGISILVPAETAYGLQTLHRVGLKGKCAVAGNDSVHFFLDNLGQLWKYGEEMEKLDYSEYLFDLGSNVVLSWDAASQLLYICDGSQGFIYSVGSASLGRGPVNITGVSSQTGTLFVAAPEAISMPPFGICTDIYDFGTRRIKTITSFELGINLSETLYASIDYRDNKRFAFSRTLWYPVKENGSVFITCCGREFRFRFKTDNYELFELDYIKINGITHEH